MASQVDHKHLQAISETCFYHPEEEIIARRPGTMLKTELEEFIKTYNLVDSGCLPSRKKNRDKSGSYEQTVCNQL